MTPLKDTSKPTGSSSHSAEGPIVSVFKSDVVQQRAKVISMRLGIEVETYETRTTHPDETVLRQEKALGMRVRWCCHRCSAGITSAGACSKCEHARCKKCIRIHGSEGIADGLVGMRSTRHRHAGDDEGYILPDLDYTESGTLLKKRHPTGSSDLVLRKPRHRVRRTCHVCQADFAQLSKMCDKCQHVRCTDCPRDPAKQSKYPFGYPGDVFGPNSIPYYECARCWALFEPHTENGTPCRRCGEKKSDESPRAQPRAIDADYDPSFLRKLEARLDQLQDNGADPCLEQ